MATIYIKEFANQGLNTINTPMPFPLEPALAEQVVSITAGSVQSTALNNLTQLVLINADAICSIKIGANPTATATTHRLPAGGSYLFAVPPASGLKIAVITNT